MHAGITKMKYSDAIIALYISQIVTKQFLHQYVPEGVSLCASHNKTALCEDFMKLGDINLHMNMFDFHKGYILYNFRFGRNPRWRPMCSQTMTCLVLCQSIIIFASCFIRSTTCRRNLQKKLEETCRSTTCRIINIHFVQNGRQNDCKIGVHKFLRSSNIA